MIDTELKEHLEKIEHELSQMHQKTSDIKHVLWRGIIYGVGYIAGTILVIALAAWILNMLGLVPDFSHGVSEFRSTISGIGPRN